MQLSKKQNHYIQKIKRQEGKGLPLVMVTSGHKNT